MTMQAAAKIDIGLRPTQGPFEAMAAFACDNCARLMLASVRTPWDPGGDSREILNQFNNADPHDIRWLPRKGESRAFDDVPSHIAEAASEAYECFSIGAHRAAVAMTRSIVEATAKEKGITTGQLHAKINAMEAATLLRPGTAAVAHEIRQWGNDMAHGDFTDPISAEEAEGVLELMSEILQEVFQSPARLARVQALRQQSNTPGQASP